MGNYSLLALRAFIVITRPAYKTDSRNAPAHAGVTHSNPGFLTIAPVASNTSCVKNKPHVNMHSVRGQ